MTSTKRTPQKRTSLRRGPVCSICKHPDRTRIEATRVAGASLDAIASKFSCSRDSLHRHMANHVTADQRSQYLADAPLAELAQLAASEGISVLQYLSLVRSVLMQEFQLASQAHAHHATSALAGRLNETLKLIGSISGEMSELARSVTINGNVNILNHPQVAAFQAVILEALEPAEFERARQAVVMRLRSFDAERAPAAATIPDMKTIEHHHVT
jgi:hypothetical protein